MSQGHSAEWSIFLLVILTLISAILIPNTVSRDAIVTFNPPGCEIPCVLGVTPGETAIEEARNLIQQMIPVEQLNADGTIWVENGNGNALTIEMTRTDPRSGDYVSMIEIVGSDAEPIAMLGNFLERYGEPNRVFRSRVSGPKTISLLATFEGDSILVILSDSESINQSTPVVYMILIAPIEDDIDWRLNDIRTVNHYEDEVDWLGYTKIKNYWKVEPRER